MAYNQHIVSNAGNTLSRAGTSARQGLSTFFGINKESRDIWSEKFKQRINQQKVGLTLRDEKEALTTLSRRLSLRRSTRVSLKRQDHTISPDPGIHREAIELDDEVFLSPNNAKLESALLITDKEEALGCYRRMIETSKQGNHLKTPLAHSDSSEWFGVNTLVRVGAHDVRSNLRTPASLARERDIKVQLESLPEFTPWFIYLVTLAQIVFLCFMLWSYGGIHTVGLAPYTTYQNNTPTVRSSLDRVHRTVTPNLWLGPDENFLIKFGAKFSPCMREDHLINIRYTHTYGKQESKFVCCQFESVNRNWVGYTTRAECVGFGKVLSNKHNCSAYTDIHPMYTHKFRPCCTNVTGGCTLTSQEHCIFLHGLWQEASETCSQVNCLSQICGMSKMKSKNEDTPYIIEANQGYRLVTSLFVHAGVAHLVLTLMAQLILGSQIERTAGWFRIMLIYITSGVGGNLISSVFVPYQATCGAGGPVYGLLGVVLVEFLQSYQVVVNPGIELVKLLSVIALSLLIGTLPYLDNFAHIGGMIFGVLSAYLFLPYITFGKFDYGRKVCQIVIAFLLIVFLFIVGFVAFYIVQGTDWCRNCYYLNCIPYTDKMCQNNFISL